MPKICPKCKSDQFLLKSTNHCVKCRALDIEKLYLQYNEKIPAFSALDLFDKYFIDQKTLREIANNRGVTPTTIRYWLIKYEIPIRSTKQVLQKEIDSTFFKKLNTKSAFLLGYFFSDGDLLINKKSEKFFLRLYSKYNDKIEKVQSLLKTNAKIQYRKKKFNDKERKGALYFIHIANQEIVKDLIKLGMVYNKNQSAKFPNIPEKLHSHFIRGLWAGSGTVYLEKGTKLRSKIVIGSIDLITEIEQILNSNGLSKKAISKSSHSKKPSYSFKYNTYIDQKNYLISYTIDISMKLLRRDSLKSTKNTSHLYNYAPF